MFYKKLYNLFKKMTWFTEPSLGWSGRGESKIKVKIIHFIFNLKDDILSEQKRLMHLIYEEKRKIAEDRAKLDAELASYKDKQHKDSLSNINIEAELSVGTRRLTEEKLKTEQYSKELREKEISLKEEKVILEEKKRELDAKTAKLEQMAFAVNQKYTQAEDLLAVGCWFSILTIGSRLI